MLFWVVVVVVLAFLHAFAYLISQELFSQNRTYGFATGFEYGFNL